MKVAGSNPSWVQMAVRMRIASRHWRGFCAKHRFRTADASVDVDRSSRIGLAIDLHANGNPAEFGSFRAPASCPQPQAQAYLP